jgi:hypothetical protein
MFFHFIKKKTFTPLAGYRWSHRDDSMQIAAPLGISTQQRYVDGKRVSIPWLDMPANNLPFFI